MPMMLQDLMDQLQQPGGMPPPPPPGAPPSALAAQLMGLGSIDQRHKLLQGQFDQGGQIAAGAPVDYSKGKGAPLALAGIANLVSAGLGGYEQGKATKGLRGLVTEQDAGRTAAADAVQKTPMSDLQSALTASPADASAKLQAAQDASAQRSKLGMLLGMTGDPQLAGTGKTLAGEADRDRETMLGMPMARAGLAGADLKNQEGQVGLQEAIQKLRKAKTAQDALENPATEAALRASIGKMIPDVDFSSVPAAALQQLEPIAAKIYATRESAEARKLVAQTNADARSQAQSQREEQGAEKRWTQFGQELDPTKARGGEMAKVVNSITQYGKVKQLIEQSPNPSSNQMYEMARAFDRAVSGGVATEGGTQHLIPKTALGSVSDFAQWLSNSPVGRNQQAFVKQLSDSIDRETGYGQKLLREWQGKKASRFSDLAKRDQGRFEAELQNWGLAPEEFDPSTWTYRGAPAALSPSAVLPKEGSQTSARPQRTVSGETREWDGQKWVPIGK